MRRTSPDDKTGLRVALVAGALLTSAMVVAVPVQADDQGCITPNVCLPNLDVDPKGEVKFEVKPYREIGGEVGGDVVPVDVGWTGIVQVTFEEGTKAPVPGVGGTDTPCNPWGMPPLSGILGQCTDIDPLGVDDERHWVAVGPEVTSEFCLFDAVYRVDLDGDGTWDVETDEGKMVTQCT